MGDPELPNRVCRFCESKVCELYDYWALVKKNQEHLLSLAANASPTVDMLHVDVDCSLENDIFKTEDVDPQLDLNESEVVESIKSSTTETITNENRPKNISKKSKRFQATATETNGRQTNQPKSKSIAANVDDKIRLKEQFAEEDKFIKKFFGLKCDECDVSFDTLIKWRTHLRTSHSIAKPALECCGQTLTDRRRIVEHLTLHTKPDELK